MKKLFLLLMILVCLTRTAYAQFEVKVDERFELVSIIFALAGVGEYCHSGIPSYFQDVDIFEPHFYTEPVNFIRELNIKHRIGYSTVPATACFLEIKDGEIRLQDRYTLSEVYEFDSRWTEDLFEKYIEMLNVFYKESNFHQFFEDHRELYEIAEQRISEYIADVSTGWIESFFGKPFDPEIKIYLSLMNGPYNYAIPEGVLIGMFSDEEGLPVPKENLTIPVLVHEILHHYTNPLFDAYWEELKPAGEKIYPRVEEKMVKGAYGTVQHTIKEWLNHLCVLMYRKDTGDSRLEYNISSDMKKGFIWMERSCDFMENFYARRDLYPTIEEFMPQLVAFLNFTAENFEFIEREYKYSHPYIKSIYPAPGSDITEAEEIIITFSELMLGSYGFNGWPEGTEPLAAYGGEWIDDYRYRIKLTPNVMKRGHTYGIILHPIGFISAQKFTLDEKCTDLFFKID